MLYPKIYTNKKEIKFIEQLQYIKEKIVILLTSTVSYNAFILFLEQKFHF